MFRSFPTDSIYYQRVDGYEKINESILNSISKSEGTEGICWKYSKVTTTYFDGEDYFLKEFLKPIVWDPLDKMLEEDDNNIPWNEVKNNPINSSVFDMWYNIYTEGEYQEIHNHYDRAVSTEDGVYENTFSFIYIVELPPGQPNKTIFTKQQNLLGGSPMNRVAMDTSKIEEIGVGSVIIFPHHLDHYVLPFYGEGRRVSVAGNIKTTFA